MSQHSATTIFANSHVTTKCRLNATHCRQRVQLLCLPTELLLLIFRDLPSRDLYALSLLCRRLHYLALPLYLSLWSIHNPFDLSSETVSLSHPGAPPIQGLRLALFITTIKRFEFTFANGVLEPDVLLEEFRQVRRLLAKVHVEEVVLDFGQVVLERMKKRFGTVLEFKHRPMNWRDWCSVSGSLLMALGGMSDTSLTVLSGRMFIPGYEQSDIGSLKLAAMSYSGTIDHPSVGRNRCCPVKHAFERLMTSKWRRRVPSWLSGRNPETMPYHTRLDSLDDLRPHAFIHLTEFNIHSPLFFQHPFVEWTIATLRSPSIMALSFQKVLNLSDEAWAIMLPYVTLPSLTEFSVASSNLSFTDLLHFLARHPSITTLNLCGSSLRLNTRFSGPLSVTASHPLPPHPPEHRLSLPHLKTLCASADYAAHLLSIEPARPDMHAFPSLDLIVIKYSAITMIPYADEGFDVTDYALRSLSCTHNIASKEISLHLLIHGSTTFAASLAQFLDTNLEHAPYSLPFVTDIMVDECLKSSTFSQNMMRLLPRWFKAIFPALKRISLGRRCYVEARRDEEEAFTRMIGKWFPGCTLEYTNSTDDSSPPSRYELSRRVSPLCF